MPAERRLACEPVVRTTASASRSPRCPASQRRWRHGRPRHGRVRLHDTARAPEPPPRPPQRMPPPRLQHSDLHRRRHLTRTRHRPVRTVRQPLQPARLVPGQPPMQCLPRDTPRRGDLGDRAAIADDRQHSPVPLLSHTHLPHTRERQRSADIPVNHQPKHRQPSAEARSSTIRRSRTSRESWRGDSNP